MRYRLRYQQHDFELSGGEFVIGRGSDCQLAVDDALVSRRHAMLSVQGDVLTIEDLGSRNGVNVNGAKIDGRKTLGEGDKIRIGSQDMTVLRMHKVQAQTLAQPAPTLKSDAFGLLGGLADKALAMGKGDEAERILSVHLTNILDDANGGRPVAKEVARQAALYAAKVAASTGKGRWVDYVFALYTSLEQLVPAEVVDELYVVVRKVKKVTLGTLREYVAKTKPRIRGPADKFLLNRVEGLERLIAAK